MRQPYASASPPPLSSPTAPCSSRFEVTAFDPAGGAEAWAGGLLLRALGSGLSGAPSLAGGSVLGAGFGGCGRSGLVALVRAAVASWLHPRRCPLYRGQGLRVFARCLLCPHSAPSPSVLAPSASPCAHSPPASVGFASQPSPYVLAANPPPKHPPLSASGGGHLSAPFAAGRWCFRSGAGWLTLRAGATIIVLCL